MIKVWVWLQNFKYRQEGQGMTEYGLILALIAVALIAVLGKVSGGLSGIYEKICTALNTCT